AIFWHWHFSWLHSSSCTSRFTACGSATTVPRSLFRSRRTKFSFEFFDECSFGALIFYWELLRRCGGFDLFASIRPSLVNRMLCSTAKYPIHRLGIRVRD